MFEMPSLDLSTAHYINDKLHLQNHGRQCKKWSTAHYINDKLVMYLSGQRPKQSQQPTILIINS